MFEKHAFGRGPETTGSTRFVPLQTLEPRVLYAAQSLSEIPDQTTTQDGAAVSVSLGTYFDDPTITGTTVRFESVLGNIDIELFDDKVPLTVENFLKFIDADDFVNSFIHRSVPDFVIQGGGFTFDDADGVGNVPDYGNVVNEFHRLATVSGNNAAVTQGSSVIQLPVGTDLSNVSVGDRIRLIGRPDGEVLQGVATDFFEISAVNDGADTVTVLQTPTAVSGAVASWYIVAPQNLRGTLAMAKLGGDPDSATNNFFINLADTHDNLDIQNEGFTVFARVLGSGLNVVDAIAGLQRINAGGAFSDLPVRDYEGGPILDENLANFTGTDRVKELSYSVSVLSGGELADVSVDANGQLIVTPKAGQSGTIQVRVVVTSLDGGDPATQDLNVTINPVDGGDTGGGDTGGGSAPAPVLVKTDFNGDGKADLVFRNVRTGQHQVWLMDGETRIGTVELPEQKGDRWLFGGVSDFDGDGDADLIFRNNNNTRNRIWEFEGTTFVQKHKLPSFKNPNVIIGGVGDFDGDGDTDIWWRQTQFHNNIVWEMDGLKRVGRGRAANHKVNHRKDGDWLPYGAGDLNGDGTDDMIFRQTSTGVNEVVLIKNRAVDSVQTISSQADAAWVIGGYYDGNGDGKMDIVWRNNGTGANMLWRMNNTAFESAVNLTSLDDTDWRLPGPGVL